MILILYTRLQEKLDKITYDAYIKLLPAAVQNRINRFRNWQDAHRSLFGNLLLLEGLKYYGITNLTLNDLSYSEYNRPYFPNIDFNISHSGKFIVCAISKNNKVGIDIEEIIEIPVNEFTEEFSAVEIAAFSGEKGIRNFYTLWTQKEAFLKAIGKGLSIPLNQVSVKEKKIYWENKEWFLHELNFNSDYVSYLCTDSVKPDIILKKMNF